jgi:hypothetical protein
MEPQSSFPDPSVPHPKKIPERMCRCGGSYDDRHNFQHMVKRERALSAEMHSPKRGSTFSDANGTAMNMNFNGPPDEKGT